MPGMGKWVGTFAEYFLSKPAITFKLKSNTTLEEGVLAEPLATAIHSIRQAKLKPGNAIAILGAGPIGLFTGLAAGETGANTIAVTDLIDFNLSLAADLFDALTYNAQTENIQEKIIDDHPDRYDVVCLCGNAPVMIDQAMEIIKPGGRIVVTGMFLKPINMPLLDITLREIEMIGTQIYDHADFSNALDFLNSGRCDFDKTISHTISLEKAQEAMNLVLDPKENTAKVLLRVDHK
jgi:threonine dehydrogenase-like Zn-dependent dehydrogenase